LLAVIMLLSAFSVVPFTANAADESSYKDEIINALLKSENDWYEGGGNAFMPSGMMFIDLNFDGKLEFVMQYGGGSMLNCDADAYYYDTATGLTKSLGSDSINNMGAFQNHLTGYYDKANNNYIILGVSYARNGISESWVGNFELTFDGNTITTDYYSSRYYKDDIYTYYNGAAGYYDITDYSEISESEYNEINDKKLENLVDINMDYDFIYCSDWENYSDTEKQQALENAYDSFSYDSYTSGIKIYSDHSSLSVKKGDTINIGAGLFEDTQQITDISTLTFSIDDTSILRVSDTSVHDYCFFLTLKANTTGTTYVTFSDSKTGYTTRVSVTVYDNNLMAFTVSGVPTQNIEKYTTNFYNVNGLYVDSYTYTVNDDKTTDVSFDVYNTNYIYGAVEVYDSSGNMKDAVVINKLTNNSGSIKSAVWDNTCCMVNDIMEGNLLTYRQESGYSKKTTVNIKNIPENGYIKITTDTSSSFLVALLNGVDIAMSIKSVYGDIKGFDTNSEEFAGKITKKLVEETVYAQFIKDEDKYAKKLYTNIAKEATIYNTKSLGEFANTFVNNLSELEIENLIFDTAKSFGWSTGESVFEYFAGPIGSVLNGMFAFGDLCNVILEVNDFTKSLDCGCIAIENQGGGVRACSQITVTADTNFDSNTAIKVFEILAESEYLDIIKELNPELYERIQAELSMTYNISMIKDGEETQPDGEVEVSIPIPENLTIYAYLGLLRIYRIEDDGTTTEMDVKVKNGCLVFRTDHFSLYSIFA
ncbi:MAG: hypothetical protein LUF33_05385, partial [Clostridiales bacterium]|nr:hypothetical protein [Clostridiales bacterium]